MRINLVTPYAEKDRVKALGARWDAKLKVWYVVDPKDLTPFMPWIPDLVAAQRAAEPGTAAAPRSGARPATRNSSQAPAAQVVSHCGCSALPWEPCPHSPVVAA